MDCATPPMTWFKVDDKMHAHPKIDQVDLSALGLWLLAGAWSSDYLMDGFLPAATALKLARGNQGLIADLVRAGLWEVVAEKDGYQMHDFGKYNPSRAQVEAKREQWAERQARKRAKDVTGGVTRDIERDSRVSPGSGDPGSCIDPVTPDHSTTPQSVSDPTFQPPLLADPQGPCQDPAVLHVLGLLNAARRRVIKGARDLTPTVGNTEQIAARLKEGHSPEEFEHVIAVREREVGQDPDAARWFSAVTPFIRANFARSLGITADARQPRVTTRNQPTWDRDK